MKWIAPLRGWLRDHARCALASLGRWRERPVGAVLQLIGISLALALPAALLSLGADLSRLGGDIRDAGVSAYLPPGAEERGPVLAREINAWPEVAAVDWIPPQAAREELAQAAGLGEVLESLPDNPLPGALAIHLADPAPGTTQTAQARALAERLRGLGAFDLVQVDLEWIERLDALIELVWRGAWLLGLALATAVAAGIGNTLRVEIGERRGEIELAKLVGASDAFVRRPYLYTGLWYGLGGALIAWVLAYIALARLSAPLERLTGGLESAGEALRIQPLGLAGLGWLVLVGCVLGLGAAWLTSRHHLRAIEPQ